MNTEWDELLDEIEEFLDGQADVLEGELPNKAMRLHMKLRELRPKVEATQTAPAQALRDIGKMPCIAELLGEYRDCGCASCLARGALAEMERGK